MECGEIQGSPDTPKDAVAKKRRPKRKLVPKPHPDDPDHVVSELISVVKVSLASIVRPERRDFLALVERVVLTVNKMTKRVSMLAKELLLAKRASRFRLSAKDSTRHCTLLCAVVSGNTVTMLS